MWVRQALQMFASWLFTACFAVGMTILLVLTLGIASRRLTAAGLRFWGRTMLRIAGVTLDAEGLEHLGGDAMKIAAFNHASTLDALLLPTIFPAGSVAAVKKQVMYLPFVNLAAFMFGFVVIDRGNSASARRTMARAASRMAKRRLTVFIAPEGTRTPDGEIQPFKKGIFHVALETRAPIVPVLIDGAFALHPPGRFTTSPGHLRVRVLPPRPSTGFTAETIGAEAQALHDHFVVELARLRADRALSEHPEHGVRVVR